MERFSLLLFRRRLCFKHHIFIFTTQQELFARETLTKTFTITIIMPREWANLNARNIHYCVRPLLLQGDGSGKELEGGC